LPHIGYVLLFFVGSIASSRAPWKKTLTEIASCLKDNPLNQLQMFTIRAVIGLFVAVIITRMFTGRIYIPYVLGLAIIMVGLAYFSEYLRNRRNKN